MMDEKMINETAQVYLKKEIPVHITKHDGEWLNGFIKEMGSNFFMIEEFKKERMPVFFSDILNIETYTKEVKE